jgi:RNA polymerase sigma-70 factor, ECF subfamily
MNPHDDAQLIQRAKHDPEAFRALYHAWLPRVFAYVAYRVAVRADAEDITADVFMQVARSLRQFEHRGEGAFAAWLFRIASNAVVSHARRPHQRELLLDDLPELSSEQATPERAYLDRERFLRLYRAIQTLSPRRQEIVTLRFFGGLRNIHIAEVLGIDERTVAAHLSRALNDLQNQLAEALERQDNHDDGNR